MTTARVDNVSYVPGSEIELRLDLEHSGIQVPDASIASVHFYKINISRDSTSLGFGGQINLEQKEHVMRVKIPQDFTDFGIFFVSYVRGGLVEGWPGPPPTSSSADTVVFSRIVFEIRAPSAAARTAEEVAHEVTELEKARTEYRTKPHRTAARNASSVGRAFQVKVYAAGAFLRWPQQLEGYVIAPAGEGLSHASLLSAVNDDLAAESEPPLPNLEVDAARYRAATPLISVSYSRIEAIDADDAIKYAQENSRIIFEVMGWDRGQIPRQFSTVSREIGTDLRWHTFNFPSYAGYINDTNTTAEVIEDRILKVSRNSFARHMIKSYSEATDERDFGFRMLRFWAILELVADRDVPLGSPLIHGDGAPILKINGKPETTNHKHGRVYSYMRQKPIGNAQGSDASGITYVIGSESEYLGTEVVPVYYSVWDMVCAAYAVRCAVAHEGAFDVAKAAKSTDSGNKLAAQMLTTGVPGLELWLRGWAQIAVGLETSPTI